MPQNGTNYEGRRKETRRHTCNANSQVPDTGLINGAVVHNGCTAAASTTSESTLNGAKPQCRVNGYINRWYKRTKAAPPWTLRKQGSPISAVSDASGAGRVRTADIPGDISVNGATSLDTVALPCNSDQMAPRPSLSAAAKTRRRKKSRRKKRQAKVICPEDPTLPTQDKEDWENEIQEVSLTDFPDWEKMCFGVRPYGPEDLLHFALRDMTLLQMDTLDLPVIANYSPAVHHPRPVRWSCYNIPTEPDQFADADE